MNALFSRFSETLDSYRVYRIGDFSAPDFLGSYAVALILSPLIIWALKKINIHMTVGRILALVLPLALIFHLAFEVDTPFTRSFVEPGNYLPKISIAIMLAYGLFGFSQRHS